MGFVGHAGGPPPPSHTPSSLSHSLSLSHSYICCPCFHLSHTHLLFLFPRTRSLPCRLSQVSPSLSPLLTHISASLPLFLFPSSLLPFSTFKHLFPHIISHSLSVVYPLPFPSSSSVLAVTGKHCGATHRLPLVVLWKREHAPVRKGAVCVHESWVHM